MNQIVIRVNHIATEETTKELEIFYHVAIGVRHATLHRNDSELNRHLVRLNDME